MIVYNRYTPQPDGTYKRKTIQLPRHPETAYSPIEPTAESPERTPSPPVIEIPKRKPPAKPKTTVQRQEISVGKFLKDLFPKDLDTGDLLIIVLLLLMAADGNDDQSNALFTLALYLFM